MSREAETRALDIAESRANFLQALWFLASWPVLDRAAKLILRRPQDLDRNRNEILAPVAEALAGKHPLEATRASRAMIEFALDQSSTQPLQARGAPFAGMRRTGGKHQRLRKA